MSQVEKDTNPYVAVPMLTQEAAIFTEDSDIKDVRRIVDTVGKPSFLSRIGQLRMTYSADSSLRGKCQQFNGTATVFAATRKDDATYHLYAVTCAHNVNYVDPMQSKLKCQRVSFEVRESSQTDSKTLKAFEATPGHWFVHPQYNPQSRIPSHDLAIIQFEVNEQDAAHFKDMEQNMSKLDEAVMCMDGDAVTEKAKLLHIYGFPVETRGKLCGLSKQAVVQENAEMGILQYDVPTSPGQSGSPIIKIEQTRISCAHALFVAFAIIMSHCVARGMTMAASFDLAVLITVVLFVAALLVSQRLEIDVSGFGIVMNEKCVIAGIHTTGNITGNMGVKVTKETLQWMKQCIAKGQQEVDAQEKEMDASESEAQSESLYCLKVTPFV